MPRLIKVYLSFVSIFVLAACDWKSETSEETISNHNTEYSPFDEMTGTYDKQLQTTYNFTNVADMIAETQTKPGDIVFTSGFHKKNDGGGAYYIIQANMAANGMDIIRLDNGLFAKLVVQNNTVTLEQLGGKGDYKKETNTGTDNRPMFMRAMKIAGHLQLKPDDYYISDYVYITTQFHIEGGNGTVYTYNTDAFRIKSEPKTRPSIKNIEIRNTYYDDSERTTAITIGERGEWGSSIALDNVYIYDYHIGIKSFDAHAFDIRNTYPQGSQIGFYIGGTHGNANRLQGCFAYISKYAFVIESQKTLVMDSCTAEDADYAFIIDGSDKTDKMTMINPWAEDIRMSVYEYATVDLDTLEMTYVGKQNESVSVTGARYENIEETNPGAKVFPNNFSNAFQNQQEIENALKQGFVYNNYAMDVARFASYGAGSQESVLKETPFNDNERVTIGKDLTGGYEYEFEIDQTLPMTAGRVYLIQFSIKSSQSIGVDSWLSKEIDLDVVSSTARVIQANMWTDYAAIVKNGDLEGASGEVVGRAAFFDYDSTIPTTIEIARPQVVDLTSIFGVGNEPDVSSYKDIQASFPFIPYGTTGKTGGDIVEEIP